MHADQFETRLAIVRHRFATTLESKITDAVVSADHMSGSGDGVVNQVSTSYRHLHGICGIGPTVGFTATGEAARAASDLDAGVSRTPGTDPNGSHEPEASASTPAGCCRVGTPVDVSARGIGRASMLLGGGIPEFLTRHAGKRGFAIRLAEGVQSSAFARPGGRDRCVSHAAGSPILRGSHR